MNGLIANTGKFINRTLKRIWRTSKPTLFNNHYQGMFLSRKLLFFLTIWSNKINGN